MAVATCVECDEEIELPGRPRLGQKFICYSCGTRLEVVSVNPVEVDWADEEEDDDEWDEDNALLDEEEDDDDFDDLADDDDFDDTSY
jgi:lysine biosynthesis protein LysW